MINKKALRICRYTQNKGLCGDECRLYEVCIIKNKAYRDKMVNIIDYIRDLNKYSSGIQD